MSGGHEKVFNSFQACLTGSYSAKSINLIQNRKNANVNLNHPSSVTKVDPYSPNPLARFCM